MNEIVRSNLKKMKGNETGDMMPLVTGESFGGNAGRHEGNPCTGANFHYDRLTGEIKYFENIQNVPDDIKNKYREGIFRLAFKDNYLEVIDVRASKPSDNARKVLEETIVQYNHEVRQQKKSKAQSEHHPA